MNIESTGPKPFAIAMIVLMEQTITNMRDAREDELDEECIDYMADTVREINGQLCKHWSDIEGLDDLEDYLKEHMSDENTQWFEENFGF